MMPARFALALALVLSSACDGADGPSGEGEGETFGELDTRLSLVMCFRADREVPFDDDGTGVAEYAFTGVVEQLSLESTPVAIGGCPSRVSEEAHGAHGLFVRAADGTLWRMLVVVLSEDDIDETPFVPPPPGTSVEALVRIDHLSSGAKGLVVSAADGTPLLAANELIEMVGGADVGIAIGRDEQYGPVEVTDCGERRSIALRFGCDEALVLQNGQTAPCRVGETEVFAMNVGSIFARTWSCSDLIQPMRWLLWR